MYKYISAAVTSYEHFQGYIQVSVQIIALLNIFYNN
jgi:hypothetical protein